MAYQFQTIAVAGTFDRLHTGHQELLETAVGAGKNVLVGLTTPEMNQTKILAQTIQPFTKREAVLKDFLAERQFLPKVQIIPIFDRAGTADWREDLEAIIVSEQNQDQVDIINQKRWTNHLSPLTRIILPLVPAKDEKGLSSTRIRLGQINRYGEVFNFVFKNRELVLPQNQRHHFQKPLGKLLKSNSQTLNWLVWLAKKEISRKPTPAVITVGDIVTQAFLQTKTPFSLGIIDYRSCRKPLPNHFHQKLFAVTNLVFQSTNKPGTLSSQLIDNLETMINKSIFEKQLSILEVSGEEDLTVLPAVLLAPLETLIFYGQPKEGIVQIRVTEKTKEKAYKLLKKFI